MRIIYLVFIGLVGGNLISISFGSDISSAFERSYFQLVALIIYAIAIKAKGLTIH